MRWCGNCCGAPGGEGEANPGGPGDAAHHAIYNRVGRVEKFKHKDTVLFLGKAVLAAILVILLVQFIADQEVCSVNVPLDKLPAGAKKVLSGINQQDSWRCPYDKDFDVSFTFNVVALSEKTVENVTMFKVAFADKKPARNNNRVATETVKEVCGLQLEPTKKDVAGHSHYDGVFGIYFVISAALIIITVTFYAVYRISTQLWGGKRVGHAVIV